MLNVIISKHPDRDELWKFHWDGKVMTPFTSEEMEKDRQRIREEREKWAADVFNNAFISTIK